MRKICFFTGDISDSGGTERVCTIVVNELIKRNFLISILSIEQKSDDLFFELDSRVSTCAIFKKNESKKMIHFKTAVRLYRYLKKNDVDILINVDTILNVYSTLAVLMTKIKSVSWEHFNYYENLGTSYRDLGRKLAARFSDVIVTITKEDYQYFLEHLTPRCPIKQIYNPIMVANNSHEYAVNSKVLLSVGRLTYQKGFDLLIDVAEIVLKENDDWKWIILGEGEDRAKIENKISEKNLTGKVILEGNVTDVSQYYKDSSIFILTSRYEGFGLVLTEAKSYGLPTVSFRCKAGPSEIILDGINGYLIDCFDKEDMASKVNQLIKNEKRRKDFSSKSLWDTEKFEINNIIEKWVEVITMLERT